MPTEAANRILAVKCALVVKGAFDASVVPAFEASMSDSS